MRLTATAIAAMSPPIMNTVGENDRSHSRASIASSKAPMLANGLSSSPVSDHRHKNGSRSSRTPTPAPSSEFIAALKPVRPGTTASSSHVIKENGNGRLKRRRLGRKKLKVSAVTETETVDQQHTSGRLWLKRLRIGTDFEEPMASVHYPAQRGASQQQKNAAAQEQQPPVRKQSTASSSATDTVSTSESNATTESQIISKGCRGSRDLAGLSDLLTPYFHLKPDEVHCRRTQRAPSRYAVITTSDYVVNTKLYRRPQKMSIHSAPGAGLPDLVPASGSVAAGPPSAPQYGPNKTLLRVNGKYIDTGSLDVDFLYETARNWRNECNSTSNDDSAVISDTSSKADVYRAIDKIQLPPPSSGERITVANRQQRNLVKKQRPEIPAVDTDVTNGATNPAPLTEYGLRWFRLFRARKLLQKTRADQYGIIYSTVQATLNSTVTTMGNSADSNIVQGSPTVDPPATYQPKVFTASPRFIFVNDRHVACQYVSHFPLQSTAGAPPAAVYNIDSKLVHHHQQTYIQTLYICEYCMTYFRSRHILEHHISSLACRYTDSKSTPPVLSPPGVEIYRSSDGRHSVFEVSGTHVPQYCSQLCMLAKLFLDTKCACIDIEAFNFYVLTRNEVVRSTAATELTDNSGEAADDADLHQRRNHSVCMHFIGYFSKELNNPNGYNLSCLLVLPSYQQCGYGRFLIELSYLLTRREHADPSSSTYSAGADDAKGMVEPARGTPERPLSEQGRRAYKSYWRRTVARNLLHQMLVAEERKNLLSGSTTNEPKIDDLVTEGEDESGDDDGDEAVGKKSRIASSSSTDETKQATKVRKHLACHISMRALQRATGMTLSDIGETLIDMKLLKRNKAVPSASTSAVLVGDSSRRPRAPLQADVVVDLSKSRALNTLLEAEAASNGGPRHRGRKRKLLLAEEGSRAATDRRVNAAAAAQTTSDRGGLYGRLTLEEDRLHWTPPAAPSSPKTADL